MNRLSTALLLSALMSVSFSQQAFANRPATEEATVDESSGLKNNTAQTESVASAQHESPSSVEMMMQRQNQQTGDVVVLPPKEMQPGETLNIKLLDYPRRGMSMDKVKNEYGQPNVISTSVGTPPITHWTYDDRVVYFEYSTVLHVVSR